MSERKNFRLYRTWSGMLQRCTNPKNPAFDRYGGRGITVCKRWLLFDNFLADMGEKPDGKSLDRIDVNGNYELSNCRWATALEQARNARSNIVVDYKGETRCLTEWAILLGVHKDRAFAWKRQGRDLADQFFRFENGTMPIADYRDGRKTYMPLEWLQSQKREEKK